MDIEKKINALLSRAKDSAASEAEVAAALKHAKRLMEENGIVEVAASLEGTGVVKKEWTSPTKIMHPVVKAVTAIALFTETKVFTVEGTGYPIIRYYGFEVDVEIAMYLTDLVANAMEKALEDYKLTPEYENASRYEKQLMRRSFMVVMALRLRARIVEMSAERRTEEAASQTRTDIVLLKRESIAAALADGGVEARTKRARKTIKVHKGAYAAGVAAANATELSKGIAQAAV